MKAAERQFTTISGVPVDPVYGPEQVPGLEPGLHVHVSEGGISIVNEAGRFQYDPGQFGFIKNDKTRPVKMFTNPGMRFVPPPSFGEADTLTP